MKTFHEISAERLLLRGGGAVAAILVAVLVWSLATTINGSIVGHGTVALSDKGIEIQHRTGGLIRSINVAEGAFVAKGQRLYAFDTASLQSQKGAILTQLAEAEAGIARAMAEFNRQADFQVPWIYGAHISVAQRDTIYAAAKRTHESRREANIQKQAGFASEGEQLRKQIAAQKLQEASAREQLVLLEQELVAANVLYSRQLVPLSRVSQLAREKTRLSTQMHLSFMEADITRAKTEYSDAQRLEYEHRYQAEAAATLQELHAKMEASKVSLAETENDIRQSEILAPTDGIAFDLRYRHSLAVASPGERLLRIVPKNHTLVAEVNVRSEDIDQIQVGNKVVIRFSAMSGRITPEHSAELTYISPDVSTDERSGASHYRATVDLSDLNGIFAGRKLTPGMPAEIMIQTISRSVLSYLSRPLIDSFSRAFRER